MALSKDPEKRRRQLANLARGKWQKGESGNPKGRPSDRITPLFVAALGKEAAESYSGLSPGEVAAIERRLLDMPTRLYRKFIPRGEAGGEGGAADGTPAYMLGLIYAINSDMKNGKTTTIDILRERVYGKAVQPVDITTNGRDVSAAPATLRLVASKEDMDRIRAEVEADWERK